MGNGDGRDPLHPLPAKSGRTGEATTPLRPTGLPPIELDTHLGWIETPPPLRDEILAEVTGADLAELTGGDAMEVFGGGLHGAEHGMIKLTSLELRLDTSDLGGLSTPRPAETGVPTWFVHDAVEGGLGFSKRIYERAETVASRTRERVAGCDYPRDGRVSGLYHGLTVREPEPLPPHRRDRGGAGSGARPVLSATRPSASPPSVTPPRPSRAPINAVYVATRSDRGSTARRAAREMTAEVRTAPTLRGARGRTPADLDAVAETIQRIFRLVTDFPAIREFDVNPLVVVRDGARAVDLRLTVDGDDLSAPE